MTRAPRFIGYGFMAAAAALAVAMREGQVTEVGPFPAVAVALFLGMVGVMLVFTDLMVRGLYAQVEVAKRNTPEDDGAREDRAKEEATGEKAGRNDED